MISNLSRFVVIVWVFVVLVLQTSYIASLTSMSTIQQLQPAFKDIHDLMRQGDNVGYIEGSFVAQMLRDMGFEDAKLKGYDSLEMYDHALSNGSVSAIFYELPYLKLFLTDHCNKYMMVGPTYKSAGFGFAFPKGSPLLPLVSKALLQVTENELNNITEKWFGQKANCSDQDMGSRSGRLSLESFLGLFLIAGVSSTSALVIYLFNFLYENKDMLLSEGVQFAKSSLHLQRPSIRRNQSKPNAPTTNNDDDDRDGDDGFLEIEDNITNSPPSPGYHQTSHDEAEATRTHDVVETIN